VKKGAVMPNHRRGQKKRSSVARGGALARKSVFGGTSHGFFFSREVLLRYPAQCERQRVRSTSNRRTGAPCSYPRRDTAPTLHPCKEAAGL
jgi:hypothetical protein